MLLRGFLGAAARFSLGFAVILVATGLLGFNFVIDFGKSKGEGTFLHLDLEEADVDALL